MIKYLLTLLLFAASVAQATPVVTSVTPNGSSFTVNGSGFGTKAVASPLVFDNFEAGTVGSKVLTNPATVGQWDTGAGYDVPAYDNASAHSGSKSAKMVADANVYNLSLSKNGSFGILYLDWWVKVDWVNRQSRNWKPYRLYGDNDAMQQNYVIFCNGAGMSVEASGPSTFWWDYVTYPDNQWQHYQVMVKESSGANQANGSVKMYVDGQLISNHTGVVTRSNAAHWDQIRIGHYWASDGVTDCPANSGATINVDNVYIDTTWQHVELGNASTYDASTKREVQIPTAWADGSITATVSGFNTGDTVYVYVVDASGAVSTGQSFVVGGTPPPPPPACTYTYSAWGACQPDGTQTRTWTSAPEGCVGTPDVTTQSCTYVPPSNGGPLPTTQPSAVGVTSIKGNVGVWSPQPTSCNYRWYKNGVTTTNTSLYYDYTSADSGSSLVFRVTCKNATASNYADSVPFIVP